MAIYVTGDTHGKFDRVAAFCERFNTTQRDVLIILGDAGINYWGAKGDKSLKRKLAKLPITLFCVHGNHERRPDKIETYKTIPWWGAIAYREEEFPNLLFAHDGCIYDIEGKKTFVCGGAYSVDKHYRLARGANWFDDEQPNERTKEMCERRLEQAAWKVDRVLTHTCPARHVPREMFLPSIDQSTVDTTTEQWLDKILANVSCSKWLCGHYHSDKSELLKGENGHEIRFLFNDIIEW